MEDVTVFGMSLPKALLDGIKGENLLGEASEKEALREGGGVFTRWTRDTRDKPGKHGVF